MPWRDLFLFDKLSNLFSWHFGLERSNRASITMKPCSHNSVALHQGLCEDRRSKQKSLKPRQITVSVTTQQMSAMHKTCGNSCVQAAHNLQIAARRQSHHQMPQCWHRSLPPVRWRLRLCAGMQIQPIASPKGGRCALLGKFLVASPALIQNKTKNNAFKGQQCVFYNFISSEAPGTASQHSGASNNSDKTQSLSRSERPRLEFWVCLLLLELLLKINSNTQI